MIAETPARRVRHLRLAAPDEALARRGALLVEDALRTATLPGGDDSRLIVVRSLALGKIDGRGSPASVALALEQRWRHLAASAVHAEDPAAPHQPAVYFRDRAEALTLLAGRLATGRETGAWFWPLAVPGWRAGLAASDALRAVLAAALAGAALAPTLLSLTAGLLEAGALPALLAVLRPSDGPRLLAALGLTKGPPRPSELHTGPTATSAGAITPAEPALPAPWLPILVHWTQAWGLHDPRSTWLAALALAADAPARLLDPAFGIRAERLAARLADHKPLPTNTQARTVTPPEAAPRALPARAHAEAPAGNTAPSRPAQAKPPPTPAPTSPANALRPDRAGAAQGTARSPAERAPHPERLTPAPQSAIQPAPGAAYTRFAGLALALPLLARLGIADAIAAEPKLAELDLPGRILAALARGARIPADDPIRALFSRPGRCQGPCPFAAPSAWQVELPEIGPATVRGMSGRPDVRVLCVMGGRLPLALWHDAMPDAAAEWLGAGAAAGPPLPPRSDAAVLVDAWQLAARRWLAAHASLTLNKLIRRPGYVARTRTHLDVFFALRDADIRVRRAGLDLDPGWLPWCGRVVLFHYVNTPWAAEKR